MAGMNIGLGRGLDALIRETSSGSRDGDRETVAIKNIRPNPDQPRREFAEKPLEELAASIKSQGLLQPLLVRPCGEAEPNKYEIIAGERRWRACQMAGLKEVPVVIRNFTAQETLIAALVENLQREDLNPMEEALGIHLLKEEFALSQEDLSRQLGKSRSAIANSLRLLALPEEVQKDVASGKMSAGHARVLLSVTNPSDLLALKDMIIRKGLSVREAEGLASLWKDRGSFDLPAQEPSTENEAITEPVEEEQNFSGSLKSSTKGRKKPQSAKLMEVQGRITAVIGLPVRAIGSDTSGKVSISFSSNEELDLILKLLGA